MLDKLIRKKNNNPVFVFVSFFSANQKENPNVSG